LILEQSLEVVLLAKKLEKKDGLPLLLSFLIAEEGVAAVALDGEEECTF